MVRTERRRRRSLCGFLNSVCSNQQNCRFRQTTLVCHEHGLHCPFISTTNRTHTSAKKDGRMHNSVYDLIRPSLWGFVFHDSPLQKSSHQYCLIPVVISNTNPPTTMAVAKQSSRSHSLAFFASAADRESLQILRCRQQII
jgi:hypothetical protein